MFLEEITGKAGAKLVHVLSSSAATVTKSQWQYQHLAHAQHSHPCLDKSSKPRQRAKQKLEHSRASKQPAPTRANAMQFSLPHSISNPYQSLSHLEQMTVTLALPNAQQCNGHSLTASATHINHSLIGANDCGPCIAHRGSNARATASQHQQPISITLSLGQMTVTLA